MAHQEWSQLISPNVLQCLVLLGWIAWSSPSAPTWKGIPIYSTGQYSFYLVQCTNITNLCFLCALKGWLCIWGKASMRDSMSHNLEHFSQQWWDRRGTSSGSLQPQIYLEVSSTWAEYVIYSCATSATVAHHNFRSKTLQVITHAGKTLSTTPAHGTKHLPWQGSRMTCNGRRHNFEEMYFTWRKWGPIGTLLLLQSCYWQHWDISVKMEPWMLNWSEHTMSSGFTARLPAKPLVCAASPAASLTILRLQVFHLATARDRIRWFSWNGSWFLQLAARMICLTQPIWKYWIWSTSLLKQPCQDHEYSWTFPACSMHDSPMEGSALLHTRVFDVGLEMSYWFGFQRIWDKAQTSFITPCWAGSLPETDEPFMHLVCQPHHVGLRKQRRLHWPCLQTQQAMRHTAALHSSFAIFDAERWSFEQEMVEVWPGKVWQKQIKS